MESHLVVKIKKKLSYMQIKIRCIKIGIMITQKFNFSGLNTDENVKKKLNLKDKISIRSSIPLFVVGS